MAINVFARNLIHRPISLTKTAYHIFKLKKHQWKEKEELDKIQLKRLKAMLRHAYYNVPYYHKLLDSAKIKPESIKSQRDLQKIPTTTKADVQSNYQDFLARGTDLTKCKIDFTSGSTGIPLKVILSQRALSYSLALIQYPFFENGLKLRNKFVYLRVWAGYTAGSEKIPRLQRVYKPRFINHYMFNLIEISLYNPISKITEMLKEIRPDAIFTFPSALSLVSEEMKDNNISEINPKLIFSEGETLTENCRELVRSLFNTEIHNTYGSIEFNRLAFECNEHFGLHMITDCAVLEFLKDGENVDSGEDGEIVVTGLYNYEMPLIRYSIGDVGIPIDESCSCGRSWPLVKSIEGRTDEFLVLPSGRTISPRNLIIFHRPYIPGIARYQIIQEEKDRFVVNMVKRKDFSEDTIKQIKERIKFGCLGENVTVDVHVVDEIHIERTGKRRIVISKVKNRS